MPPEIPIDSTQRRERVAELKAHPPNEAALLLESPTPAQAGEALTDLNPAFAQDILAELPPELRAQILKAAAPEVARQWERNQHYAPHTIGRLMEPAYALLRKEMTVEEAIEALRSLVKTVFVTYGYVTDKDARLEGLVTMRDLLFAERTQTLADIMLGDMFAFRPATGILDGRKQIVYS